MRRQPGVTWSTITAVSIINRATERWEAVYYPNPVPLCSRSLLSFALLFDRVHFPGVWIPRETRTETEKAEIRAWTPCDPEQAAFQNLSLWSAEQPQLWDWVFLPDQIVVKEGQRTQSDWDAPSLEAQARSLLDDTYGEGTSEKAVSVAALQSLMPIGSDEFGYALTWPFYQARALDYAGSRSLPLLSDDPGAVPPFPLHPGSTLDTKALAQQLAVQALSLVLPPMRSVEPATVPEFRSEVRPLVQPFRKEMVKMTADLSAAITAGASDRELTVLCKTIAESRVIPAL